MILLMRDTLYDRSHNHRLYNQFPLNSRMYIYKPEIVLFIDIKPLIQTRDSEERRYKNLQFEKPWIIKNLIKKGSKHFYICTHIRKSLEIPNKVL